MECGFTIYCYKERATEIKIHKVTCGDHKKDQGHDDEWFYAPTYANAKIIANLLHQVRDLVVKDCGNCKPSLPQ
ncbi:MAG: hypothetical protein D9C04_07355 [Nitrosopumilus sp. B06]|nr:MAG: hypothetical protein D9C04_07355 [Nitrosopumilus sp. B06]